MRKTNLETRLVTQPRPVYNSHPHLMQFCPRCGKESLNINTHQMKVPTSTEDGSITIVGWECTSCGFFLTGTHLGVSWLDLTKFPIVEQEAYNEV